MAGTRISSLPSAGAITGSEFVPVTQDGTTKKATVSAIANAYFTGVQTFSAGTTGLTPSGPANANVVLGGTLAIANGGTGQTTALGALGALGGAPLAPQSRQVSGSTVLQLTDSGGVVAVNSSAATVVTVPSSIFPIGSQIAIVSIGSGQVTVVPQDNSVFVNSPAGKSRLSGQYSTAFLLQIGTNSWILGGDIIV